jgi:hypothetical protein
LLHRTKARIERSGGKKLNFLIGIDAKMFHDQSSHRFESATISIDAYGFTLEFDDGLYFWPGD